MAMSYSGGGTYQTILPSRSLEDIFGDIAKKRTETYKESRLPGRSQKVSDLAATGRLSSGVAENVLGQYDKDTNQGVSNIEASLLPSLFGAEENRIASERAFGQTKELGDLDYQRNLELAKLIGSMNKPSTLSEIFGGAGAAGSLIGGLAKAGLFA